MKIERVNGRCGKSIEPDQTPPWLSAVAAARQRVGLP